jgi:hypothetical protein
MGMSNWFRGLREKIEKVVFAGLKPDAPVSVKKSKLDSLLESAESFAGRGLEPQDKGLPGPTTLRKKVLLASGVLLAGALVALLAQILSRPAAPREAEDGPVKPIQILQPGVKTEKKEIEVVEIQFRQNSQPKEIVGTLRNRTEKLFPKCAVSFEVATKEGAQLGGVATTVYNLGPHAEKKFRIPVPQEQAGFVLVRELRTD